jgi:hypothetical protein
MFGPAASEQKQKRHECRAHAAAIAAGHHVIHFLQHLLMMRFLALQETLSMHTFRCCCC